MTDALDERATSGNEQELLKAAACDITTGWGVDSLFEFQLSDPWAEECLVDLIDVIVNHASVKVPLPSKQALDKMDMGELPKSVFEAHKRKLLSLKTNAFAESVELPEEILATEYVRFRECCLDRPSKIRDWVRFHRETPRPRGQNIKHVPSYVVDAFWSSRPQDGLEDCLGISKEYLNYAFDVYARTIQYHGVLEGEAWYFRHPFRKTAIARRDRVESMKCTSWGQAFLDGMHQGLIKHRLPDVMDLVATVRAASGDVNWYSLADETEEKRAQAMQDIALSCGLPGKVKDSVLRTLRIALGSAAALSSPVSLGAGVLFGLGYIAIGEWKGRVHPAASRARILQGIIERPYLPKLSELAKNTA